VDKTTVLSATDLLPTLCTAAKVALPDIYAGDGENMLAAWQGTSRARTRPIFWDWTGTERPATNWPRWAVRDGDWKLLSDGERRRELYRLSDDPLESRNLAAQQPEMVQKLEALLADWKRSLPEQPPADCISQKRRASGD
jgi:arylsulfatase A-like enzyme